MAALTESAGAVALGRPETRTHVIAVSPRMITAAEAIHAQVRGPATDLAGAAGLLRVGMSRAVRVGTAGSPPFAFSVTF